MILRRLFGTAGHRNTKFIDLTRISIPFDEIDDMINRIAVAGTISNIVHSNHIRSNSSTIIVISSSRFSRI